MGFDDEWGALRSAVAGGDALAEPDPYGDARAAVVQRLADFRNGTVLVPEDERGGPWTASFGSLDWICAFSGEEHLARFARARGATDQEWAYWSVTGARLLDELVPALSFPCGIALDAASSSGIVFPPVRGIVPDSAAVDGQQVPA